MTGVQTCALPILNREETEAQSRDCRPSPSPAGERTGLMGPRPPQRPAGDPHVHFLCRTRLDAPRLETKSLSSSVLPPSYASDRLSGNNRDPALKPKRSHRKADPDAAHRYSAAVPQHRPAKQRRGLAAGRDGWEAWGRWLGAGHCPPFQCLLSGSLGLVAFSTKPWQIGRAHV